jgi:alanine dehydrogenase
MEPAIVSKEKVAELLPMSECISLMEKAFRALGRKDCIQPLRSIMSLPNQSGFLGMMPAYSSEIGVMGIKVISIFPGNKTLGSSSHQGTVLLFDAEHGQLLCMLDAGEITAIRTAAVSALATQLLSKKDSKTLAVLGSGEQAESHIEAMMLVRNIETIRLWSRNAEHAGRLASQISSRYSANIIIADKAQDCVEEADLICAVTASPEPILKGEWLAHGVHMNAVGSCTPRTRELDSAAVLKSKLFTDKYESLFNEAGDFIIPKNEGILSDSHVKGELAEILSGEKPGRESNEEITLFKSLGIGIEDLYAAHYIYGKIKNGK